MILVTGASGKIGRSLVNQLVAAGHRPRAMVRASTVMDFGPGVDTVVVDYRDEASLVRALDGIEGVFLMAPVPLLAEHSSAMVAAIRRSRVKHVALLSSLSLEMDHGNLFREEHAAAESAVMALDRGWTVLRAGELMSNALAWAPAIKTAQMVEPFVRNIPCARIDPFDVAAVASRVLTAPAEGHAGNIYALTGDEATTPEACVNDLAGLLGVTLRYSDLSDDQAEQAWARMFGDTPEARERIRCLRETDLPWLQPRPTTRQVLGRTTRPFGQWTTENLSAFQ
jgi:uncharacterized protein YbjT (DUF2867 family)